MTKIRCGSSLCIHNYKTEDGYCDAEEVEISDIITTNKYGEKEHYHKCYSYEEGEEIKKLQDIIRKALGVEER